MTNIVSTTLVFLLIMKEIGKEDLILSYREEQIEVIKRYAKGAKISFEEAKNIYKECFPGFIK